MKRFEYLWQDAETFKRPTKMSAPEYIEHLMAWVQGNIDNEQTFPSRIGGCIYLLDSLDGTSDQLIDYLQ